MRKLKRSIMDVLAGMNERQELISQQLAKGDLKAPLGSNPVGSGGSPGTRAAAGLPSVDTLQPAAEAQAQAQARGAEGGEQSAVAAKAPSALPHQASVRSPAGTPAGQDGGTGASASAAPGQSPHPGMQAMRDGLMAAASEPDARTTPGTQPPPGVPGTTTTTTRGSKSPGHVAKLPPIAQKKNKGPPWQ